MCLNTPEEDFTTGGVVGVSLVTVSTHKTMQTKMIINSREPKMLRRKGKVIREAGHNVINPEY